MKKQRKQRNNDDDDGDNNDIIGTTQQQQQQQQQRQNLKIIIIFALQAFIVGVAFGYFSSLQSVSETVAKWKITNETTTTTTTTNDDNIIIYGTELAKAWEPIANSSNDIPVWCVPQHENNMLKGLFYVKIPKAASSTGAGITLQIAKNVAQRINQSVPCSSYQYHGKLFLQRSQPNYLWTMLREPSKRSLSDFFFFEVSRKGDQPTPSAIIKHLDFQRMFQIHYVSKGGPYKKDPNTGLPIVINSTDIQQDTVTSIIQDKIINVYDFIGLVERMDESLVVLKMLMNLQDEDIIVLSSKQSGGYDAGNFQNRCYPIPKSYTTPEVDEYLKHDYKQSNPDYILYHVANVSLDMTIDALGREKVQQGVHHHVKLKEIATKYCSSKAIFPCSKNGVKQPEAEKNCLWNDAACGYECIDEILKKYKKGEIV